MSDPNVLLCCLAPCLDTSPGSLTLTHALGTLIALSTLPVLAIILAPFFNSGDVSSTRVGLTPYLVQASTEPPDGMPGTDKLFRYWLGTFGSCVQTPARGDAGEPEVRCVSGGDYGGMGATLRPFEEYVINKYRWIALVCLVILLAFMIYHTVILFRYASPESAHKKLKSELRVQRSPQMKQQYQYGSDSEWKEYADTITGLQDKVKDASKLRDERRVWLRTWYTFAGHCMSLVMVVIIVGMGNNAPNDGTADQSESSGDITSRMGLDRRQQPATTSASTSTAADASVNVALPADLRVSMALGLLWLMMPGFIYLGCTAEFLWNKYEKRRDRREAKSSTGDAGRAEAGAGPVMASSRDHRS